jgi:deoxyribonuclease V
MDEKRIEHVFSVRKAHEAQLLMSKNIICRDKLSKRILLVAGVDVAYTDNVSIGAVAVHEYDSLRLVENQIVLCKTRFPYIPTLLSFREIEPAVLCIQKLRVKPDVFLVDGHGFAHPYHCGFASHLGLVLKKPTIGIAKNRLAGRIWTPASGTEAYLIDSDQNVIGAVIKTKRGCRPVYVSIGHMVSLETAVKIVRHCIGNSRLPDPILAAHRTATNEKRKINILSTVKTRK